VEPEAPASLSTINDATTPRRGAFVEQITLPRASDLGWLFVHNAG
jgi:hypothetical protein